MVRRRLKRGGREAAVRRRGQAVDVSLPDEPSDGVAGLQDLIVWLYGEPGVGKTTLSSQFEGAFHLMFEKGAKTLKIYQSYVESWPEVEPYFRKIAADDRFQTTVVDVVETMYTLCFDYMVAKMGHHPGEVNDRGKSWNLISGEFFRVLRVAQSKGLVLLSHAAERTIKTAIGDEYTKIGPNLSSSPLGKLDALADVVGYVYPTGDRREMQIRADDLVMAKCRPTNAFLHTDETPVKTIDLGSSYQEAYVNFEAAFKNELEKPYEKKSRKEVKKLRVKRRRR